MRDFLRRTYPRSGRRIASGDGSAVLTPWPDSRRFPNLARLPEVLRALPWDDLCYTLWIPAYLICFALLEAVPLHHYWATQLPLDQYIPYCSWFFIPYSMWYFLLILTGFRVFALDRAAFRRYMRFLSVTTWISVVFWILVPNGQDLRPASPDGLLGPAIATLYSVDTSTNVFPSLHVVGSIGAALAAWDALWDRDKFYCLSVYALAALICLSTMFIKQHSVLDVIGGAALSWAAARRIYARPARIRRRAIRKRR